jgi:multiple sugar transport system permease protein
MLSRAGESSPRACPGSVGPKESMTRLSSYESTRAANGPQSAAVLTARQAKGAADPGRAQRRGPIEPLRARLYRSRRRFILAAFILPAIAYVIVFFAYPLGYGILMSLENFGFGAVIKGGGPFVGLHNYTTELADPTTQLAMEHTAIFLVVSIVFQYSIGLGIALYFNRRFVLARFFRSLIIIPWLFPAIATGTVFSIMFSGDNGIVDSVLKDLHVIHSPIYWFTSSLKGMFVITLVNIWAGIPFNTVILHAGLQDVPRELHEAAELDGANPWQRLRFVTLPVLRPVSLIVIMLGIIYTVKVFDIVIVLTNGGPINGTQLLSTWSYTLAFSEFDFGQGAAIGNILLVFCMIVGYFYIRTTRQAGTGR